MHQVISPETARHPQTTNILRGALPVRCMGAVPTRTVVVGAGSCPPVSVRQGERNQAQAKGASGSGSEECPDRSKNSVVNVPVDVATGTGVPFGAAINAAIQSALSDASARRAAVDLVLLDLEQPLGRKEAVELDPMVPSQPLMLGPFLFAMSPAQLRHCNGVSRTARNGGEAAQSLLARISATMGAVTTPAGAPALHPIVPDLAFWLNGLADHAADPRLRDGRIVPVRPLEHRNAPLVSHGWLSSDTKSMIAAALAVADSNVVLELGAWYGLSTRHMLRIRSDVEIWSADWYKAPAMINYRLSRLTPSDKLFLNHPRMECFLAGVSATMAEQRQQVQSSLKTTSSHTVATSSLSSSCSSSSLYGVSAASAGGTAAQDAPRQAVMAMKMDANEAIRHASRIGIKPGVVFIDCEKKTIPLIGMLRAIRSFFPDAIIVGDDYIYPSVRKAVAAVVGTGAVAGEEAYCIAPPGLVGAFKAQWKLDEAACRPSAAHLACKDKLEVKRGRPDAAAAVAMLPGLVG